MRLKKSICCWLQGQQLGTAFSENKKPQESHSLPALRSHWCIHSISKPGRFFQFSWSFFRGIGACETYRHHIVTLHVRLVFILAFIVELSKEIEGHHGVEINHHGQQTHRQHQLEEEKRHSLALSQQSQQGRHFLRADSVLNFWIKRRSLKNTWKTNLRPWFMRNLNLSQRGSSRCRITSSDQSVLPGTLSKSSPDQKRSWTRKSFSGLSQRTKAEPTCSKALRFRSKPRNSEGF